VEKSLQPDTDGRQLVVTQYVCSGANIGQMAAYLKEHRIDFDIFTYEIGLMGPSKASIEKDLGPGHEFFYAHNRADIMDLFQQFSDPWHGYYAAIEAHGHTPTAQRAHYKNDKMLPVAVMQQRSPAYKKLRELSKYMGDRVYERMFHEGGVEAPIQDSQKS